MLLGSSILLGCPGKPSGHPAVGHPAAGSPGRDPYPLPSGHVSVYAARGKNGKPLASTALEQELGQVFGQGLSAEPFVRDSVLHIRYRAETGALTPDSATTLAIRFVRIWKAQHPAQAETLETAHRRLVDSLMRHPTPALPGGTR